MKEHAWAVIAVQGSAFTCGATFLLALYRTIGDGGGDGRIALGVELYLLSSSVGDLIEEKGEPSKSREWIAMGWLVRS